MDAPQRTVHLYTEFTYYNALYYAGTDSSIVANSGETVADTTLIDKLHNSKVKNVFKKQHVKGECTVEYWIKHWASCWYDVYAYSEADDTRTVLSRQCIHNIIAHPQPPNLADSYANLCVWEPADMPIPQVNHERDVASELSLLNIRALAALKYIKIVP